MVKSIVEWDDGWYWFDKKENEYIGPFDDAEDARIDKFHTEDYYYDLENGYD